MRPRSKQRAVCAGAAAFAVVAMIAAGGCRGAREHDEAVRLPVVTPTPRPTPKKPRPRASGLPKPSPSPSATRDPTREPLTRQIDDHTPPRKAKSLELAEHARTELQSGTTESAIELANQALASWPTSVPAYVIRARAYLAEGSTPLARADLERAAKLSPEPAWSAEIVALTGVVQESDGHRDAAIVAYKRAVVLFPANQTAREALRRLSAQ